MPKNECKHEHPHLKGAWCEYISGTKWRIGWCCAECGHVEKTGTVPGKPHWGKRP